MRIRKLTAQLTAIAILALVFWVLSVLWVTYLREVAIGYSESDLWEQQRAEQEMMCR